MQRYLLILAAILITAGANAQLKTPAPSPTQTVKQDFGLSSVEVNYSRPGVKKRKIFGDVVPFDKVWRTGANSATTITFGDDVTVGGVHIVPGKYGILSIPSKSNWIIIISKQTDVTNPVNYKPEMDVVRVNVAVNKIRKPVESFSIQFADIKPTSIDLHLMWDKTDVVLPILTDIDDKIMASIDAAMKTEKPPYFQAAQYYMDNGKDLNKALDWFNKAVEADPTAYFIQYQWANCLAKMGKFTEAKAAATHARELAVTARNDDYVRLNDKLLKEISKSK